MTDTIKRLSPNEIKNMAKKYEKSHKPVERLSQASQVQPNDVTEILQDIMKEFNIDESTAMLIIAAIAQLGGANAKALDIGYTINDTTIKASDILRIIKKRKPDGSNRQFLTHIRNNIVDYSSVLAIEGDLAKKIRADIPDISHAEALWASTFQTDNPAAPDRVKAWLAKDKQFRINKNNNSTSNQQ